MRRKKVVFYTENYIYGGVERFLFDVLSNLDRNKYEVALLHNDYPGFEQRLKRAGGEGVNKEHLNIYSDTLHRLKIQQLAIPGIIKLGYKCLAVCMVRYIFFILNLIYLLNNFSRRKIDILHIVNGGYPGGDSCRAAVIAGRLKRIPCIIMSQLSTPVGYSNKELKPVEYFIDKLVCYCVDFIISPADKGTELMHSRRKFSTTKLRTIHLGIKSLSLNTEENIEALRRWLKIPSGHMVIGMVAQFVEYKGQRYLIEAAHKIKKMNLSVKYVLVGGGEDLGKMKKLSQEYNLSNDIIFTGYLGTLSSDPSVAGVMNIFDIFVHSSLYEGFPFVVLEAMSLGKPIISTNVGGIPEQIEDNISGAIVPPADGDALAKSILRFLQDEELRKKLGLRARERFEQYFTLPKMISSYEQIYNSWVGR